MTARFVVGAMAFAFGTVLFTASVLSQDKPAQPPGMPDMAEMMKKWKAVASPGKDHKLLEQFVGDWKTKMKVLPPGMPPMESEGRSSVKSVLDGRFVQEDFSGEMMMPDASGAMKPVPFKGVGLTGYDNNRKMFVGSWADNLNTHLLRMTGHADPSGKAIVMYGEMDEPMLDVYGRMVKYVTKLEDKDKHVFEIYELHAGLNMKVLEITYTRVK